MQNLKPYPLPAGSSVDAILKPTTELRGAAGLGGSALLENNVHPSAGCSTPDTSD